MFEFNFSEVYTRLDYITSLKLFVDMIPDLASVRMKSCFRLKMKFENIT